MGATALLSMAVILLTLSDILPKTQAQFPIMGNFEKNYTAEKLFFH